MAIIFSSISQSPCFFFSIGVVFPSHHCLPGFCHGFGPVLIISHGMYMYDSVARADSRFAPNQWETVLLCKDASHWLGATLESTLIMHLWTEVKSIESHIPGVFCWHSVHEADMTCNTFPHHWHVWWVIFLSKSINAELCGVLLLSLTITNS